MAGFMTHVTCRLNWDQLRNHALGNWVWATFTFLHFKWQECENACSELNFVPWLYIAVDYFVMQLGRVSDEVFIMDFSYLLCAVPSHRSISDRQLILRLCVCGCSGLHRNAVWPCVWWSVHNGLQLSQCVIPSLGSIRDRQVILRLCVCGCSGLHCDAVWPRVRGSVHNGLQLSAVCTASVRHRTRQLWQQTRLRMTASAPVALVPVLLIMKVFVNKTGLWTTTSAPVMFLPVLLVITVFVNHHFTMDIE